MFMSLCLYNERKIACQAFFSDHPDSKGGMYPPGARSPHYEVQNESKLEEVEVVAIPYGYTVLGQTWFGYRPGLLRGIVDPLKILGVNPLGTDIIWGEDQAVSTFGSVET